MWNLKENTYFLGWVVDGDTVVWWLMLGFNLIGLRGVQTFGQTGWVCEMFLSETEIWTGRLSEANVGGPILLAEDPNKTKKALFIAFLVIICIPFWSTTLETYVWPIPTPSWGISILWILYESSFLYFTKVINNCALLTISIDSTGSSKFIPEYA